MVECGYHSEWYTLLIIDIIDWNDLEKFGNIINLKSPYIILKNSKIFLWEKF